LNLRIRAFSYATEENEEDSVNLFSVDIAEPRGSCYKTTAWAAAATGSNLIAISCSRCFSTAIYLVERPEEVRTTLRAKVQTCNRWGRLGV
jgi:hypothetical protein